jgi:hypothetical protein
MPRERRKSGLWRVRIRDDWCYPVGPGAARQRWLCRALRVRAVGCADHSCRAHLLVPGSSQCHRVREILLPLNATPIATARARWHSLEARPQCDDRYWPGVGVRAPRKSPGESTSSTSWRRWERRRPGALPSGPLSIELSKTNRILVGPVGVEPTKGLLLRQLRMPVPPRA